MAYDYKTVAVAEVEASPVVNKNAYRGNVQCIPVDYTVPSGNIAQNKTLALSATLPATAKVIRVAITGTDLGNNIKIGVTGDDDAILGSTSTDGVISYIGAPVDAAGKEIFATAVDTWTAANTLKGYILIVTDE
jgi:hypothetical protein